MTVCSPFRSTVTVSGASFKSFSTSSPVFFLERASNHLPSVTRVRIIAADSKNRLFIASSATRSPSDTPMINMTTRLYK